MIKNIIFDLGGVILNISRQTMLNNFNRISQHSMESLFKSDNVAILNAFEMGKLSPEEFRENFRKITKLTHLPDEQFDINWNSMLLDLPPERLNIILALRKQCRTFLLSNTNEIHLKAIDAILIQNKIKEAFNNCFEKEYYSCRMGMRKPNAEIYEFVLTENNLIAHETLFVDDTLSNVEAAQRCGLQGFHINPKQTLHHLANHIM